MPAELRQAIKERREGLKNKKRTKEDLWGKLQEGEIVLEDGGRDIVDR